MKFKNIGVVADNTPAAENALHDLSRRYKLINLDQKAKDRKTKPDVIIALGGDGFMLHTLHRYIDKDIPIYGMNCGTVGFLMNEYRASGLTERLSVSRPTPINPLEMEAIDNKGKSHKEIAFNEVSLLRKTRQAAKLKIIIDGQERMGEMTCDGVLVSTPAGSSAYNSSVGGPIIPLKIWLLAITPISPFRPRRWRGALLPDKVVIRFEVKYPKKRPVNAVADFHEVENVQSVEIKKNLKREVTLLFDPGHSLEERILKEQFMST